MAKSRAWIMTPAQWERVKQATADALELEAVARSGFIHSACGDDPEVLSETLRLVAEAEGAAIGFLSTPRGIRDFVLCGSAGQPSFVPGQTVANRFRVEAFLNRGGMGEVYAAFDLELREHVALKTIHPAIASRPDVIERFKAEVKQTRRIAHRNVCRVYDLFSHEQPSGEALWFLTMELLEGETLVGRLASHGPLRPRRALSLIRDMAAGLTAAHELGIVHRDFKPGNVMLVGGGTENERAVVMDFGLALEMVSGAAGAAADGTPAYMAPEQRAAKPIGPAADQFAFGMVIGEMLTGERPRVDGESAERSDQLLDGWLRSHDKALSRRLRKVLRRCLAFHPERRWDSVNQAAKAIEGTRSRWAWAAVAAAAVGLALLGVGRDERIIDLVQLTPRGEISVTPGLSWDGRWVAYASDRQGLGNIDIWLQPARGGVARRLTTDPAEDWYPSVSPDGTMVAFRSERNGGGLYLVSAGGTGERLLVDGGRTPAFSPDGRWIAYWTGMEDDTAASGRIYLVSPSGGAPRRLAADFADARLPTWNSSGEALMFQGCRAPNTPIAACSDWWTIRTDGTGAANSGVLALAKSQGIRPQLPPRGVWRSHSLFFSGFFKQAPIGPTVLLKVGLSPDASAVRGRFTMITAGDVDTRQPVIARDGEIAFNRAIATVHVWRIPWAGEGPASRPIQVTADTPGDAFPSVSRNGRFLFSARTYGYRQIVMRELASGRESVLTTGATDKFWPVPNAAGDLVAFEMRDNNGSSIWLMKPGGTPRRLCAACSHPSSWFGDGAVFYTTAAGGIALLDLKTGQSTVVLSGESDVALSNADWSPESEQLLFTASRGARPSQIFVTRFPRSRRMAVGSWTAVTASDTRAELPRWSTDGKSVVFLSNRDGRLCVWVRPFDPLRGRLSGQAFALMHYHESTLQLELAAAFARGLSVSSDSVFLSVGQEVADVWVGKLARSSLLDPWRRFF